MSEQTYAQAVRESRIFYRRTLARVLAVRMADKVTSLTEVSFVADMADAVTQRLAELEECELALMPPERAAP